MHVRSADPLPKPRSAWLLLVLLFLPNCFFVLAAEELPDPAQVSWELIEAWAEKKSDKNPFHAAPEPTPKEAPASAPPPQPAETKPKPAVASPEGASAESKPAYVPIPGRRRPEPQVCVELRKKFKLIQEERLKNAIQYKRWNDAWEICFRMEEYERSLEYLGYMQKEKRFQLQVNEGWVSGRMWETAILLPRNKPSLDQIEAAFKDWKKKNQERFERLEREDQGWVRLQKENELRGFNKQESYYKNDSKDLAEVLKELEIKGDVDSTALMDLIGRYGDYRPFSPMHYACILYKLRDWYSTLELAKSGEAQMRLVYLLDRDLYLYKEAADEAEFLIDNYPNHYSVQNGDALWALAECRSKQGNEVPKRGGAEFWAEAKKHYLEFVKKYPKHWANLPKQHPDQNAGRTQCELSLGNVERALKGK